MHSIRRDNLQIKFDKLQLVILSLSFSFSWKDSFRQQNIAKKTKWYDYVSHTKKEQFQFFLKFFFCQKNETCMLNKNSIPLQGSSKQRDVKVL